MRWDDQRRSRNIENRRGQRSVGSGGGAIILLLLRLIFTKFGIAGVAIVAAGYVGLSAIGINPLSLLTGAPQGASSGAAPTSRYDDMVAAVLGSTEDSWADIFREQGFGPYPEPTLVFFAGGTQTGACGYAGSAVGPFYCPPDRKVYIDTQFFDDLQTRFGAAGDFPPAYVVAHEVGHHVQTVLGISSQVRQAQARTSDVERNALSVRMELQADCFAGLWANRFRQGLEPGDIDEALTAAAAIGDDTLQRRSGGRVNPDSFTHGTAAQRQRWFTIGYETGAFERCDTYAVAEGRL